MAREPLSKIRRAIGDLRLLDAGDRHSLDEDMRRLQDERTHEPASAAGMDERDRGAVAVADQDWIGDAALAQELRQDCKRLVVHVIGLARRIEAIGLAIAPA